MSAQEWQPGDRFLIEVEMESPEQSPEGVGAMVRVVANPTYAPFVHHRDLLPAQADDATIEAARHRVLAYLDGLDGFYSDDEEPDDVVDYVTGGSDSPALRLSDIRAALAVPVREPGRSEAEVKAEALREVAHDLQGAARDAVLIRALQIEDAAWHAAQVSDTEGSGT